MNSDSQKWIWTVLIIILLVLVLWGIVATVNRSSIPGNANQSSSTENALSGNPANTGNSATTGSGNSNQNPPTTAKKVPIISSLTPSSGKTGIIVTINGYNFDLLNNSVEFNGYNLGNSGSNDNQHIRFTVPSTIKSCVNGVCGTNSVVVGPGPYPVAVRNANGTSNIIYFNVTAANPNQ
ncbi:MAG TPA: hypothetical protein VFA52_01990 [Candidatus Paceibacterota bacterium]|nr:hypothetical protein [Candidatus Paceibacterota bacterium]